MFQWEHVAFTNPLSKLISLLTERAIGKKDGLKFPFYFILLNVIFGGLRMTDADTLKQPV
jgi:hypothetical protein